jgi:hypothetical protein
LYVSRSADDITEEEELDQLLPSSHPAMQSVGMDRPGGVFAIGDAAVDPVVPADTAGDDVGDPCSDDEELHDRFHLKV